MSVAEPCWGDTRICKCSQIYAIQDHTYIFYNKENSLVKNSNTAAIPNVNNHRVIYFR